MLFNTACNNNPKLTIPIFIQAPRPKDMTKIKPPKDWKPTIYLQKELALPVPKVDMKTETRYPKEKYE